MKNVILKSLAVALSVVIVFCCLTEPLSVSASDTPDLSLVETDLSSSEVAELVAGVDDAVLVVILVICGFIGLTYVTLRNVDAPIDFSTEDGFFDKCQSLGNYMLDHIDDNVKDVFYSIYQFVTAGTITSISSIPKIHLTDVSLFFAKISAWLSGSLLNNVSEVANGFLGLFSTDTLINNFTQYSYVDQMNNVLSDISAGFTLSNCILGLHTSSYGNIATFYRLTSFDDCKRVVITYSDSTYVYFRFYSDFSEGVANSVTCSYAYPYMYYTTGSGDVNVAPNRSSYSLNNRSTTFKYINIPNNFVTNIDQILNYFSMLGIAVGSYYGTLTDSIYETDEITWLSDVTSADVPLDGDTITQPTDDTLDIDIAAIAAAVAAGTIATTKDYYDELIAGLALTITSALSGSNFTMPEGDYYIPSLDNIWKYVEYMFSTLGSWIIFAGKCIQCVTVGEGGLSWIFYGGFIFLICGGIVGKILLG